MRTTNKGITRRTLPLCALLGAIAAPLAASAQLSPTIVTAPAVSDARALHEKAVAMGHAGTSRPKEMKRQAAMHLRAAQLRGDEHPDNQECLHTAANLLYSSGSTRDAFEVLKRAADQALSRGDVVNAAGTYLDAGLLATQLRQPEEAWRLGHKGALLAGSPLLSTEQRDALRARIVRTSELAVALRQ
jgi:hypothetical protein